MQLIYKNLKDILDIIKIANSSGDKDALRNNVLDAFSKYFHVEQFVFILHDRESPCPDFMLRNLDEKKCSEYIEYYCRLDPFKQFYGAPGKSRLLSGPFPHKDVVDLRELVEYPSFLSNEFYSDFYRPQKIFWELGAFLKSEDRVMGYIGLFRPKGARKFSKEEKRLLSAVCPYLTLAIENMELRSKEEIKSLIFDLFVGQSTSGLIVCDESLRVLFINRRAEAFCRDLNGGEFSNRNRPSSFLYSLFQDCGMMKETLEHSSSGFPLLSQKRIVKTRFMSYAVYSQCIERDLASAPRKVFVIQIEPVGRQMSLDDERIGMLFQLTKRETEIIHHIFEGLKNVEIAGRLFISEITVKKHIQNICKKMDVHSRTALIHKTLKGLNII